MHPKKHHRIRKKNRAITQMPSSRYFDGDINNKEHIEQYKKGDVAHSNSDHPMAKSVAEELVRLEAARKKPRFDTKKEKP